MKTLGLSHSPVHLESSLAERKRLGLDTHDEVWEGEHHMAPMASLNHGRVEALLVRLLQSRVDPLDLFVTTAFNLGTVNDFRVPDLGVHRLGAEGVWITTASIVVEVRSPDDETYEKFAFYFDHGVEEVLVADLVTRQVTWHARGTEAFVSVPASLLLDLSADEVSAVLGW